MKAVLKRYRFFLATLLGLAVLFTADRALGLKAVNVIGFSLKEMLLVIPPIFILLGFLDVWVPRETMVRFMGEGSGIRGAALAVLLGSAAAGPLYAAFPVAAVFVRKGASFRNVVIFIGAWSTTKIPMFLFELSALGAKFAVTRLIVDIPGIFLIGWALESLIGQAEKERIKGALMATQE